MDKKIAETLINMGADPSLKGFCYIIDALMYMYRNEVDLTEIKIGKLCERISEDTGSTPSAVERAMRYTIDGFNRKLPYTQSVIGEKRKPSRYTLQLLYLRLKEAC